MAEQLGLYDLLPTLLVPDEPWVEYGIVERRLREDDPGLFADLVERFGHIETHGKKAFTASAYLGRILGDLTRPARGPRIASCGMGPATGFWRYNDRVFYWAALPPPPARRLLIFDEWSRSRGWDPENP